MEQFAREKCALKYAKGALISPCRTYQSQNNALNDNWGRFLRSKAAQGKQKFVKLLFFVLTGYHAATFSAARFNAAITAINDALTVS
jgi:hypothetical protein